MKTIEKEEKELLLKDLSARLPYGVKIHIEHDVFYDEIEPYDCTLPPKILDDFLRMERLEVKPYLHPMSSMTEEELHELFDEEDFGFDKKGELVKRAMMAYVEGKKLESNALFSMQYAKAIDFLNAHHFDYRGLIEKGLALEAPEGMYNFEKC